MQKFRIPAALAILVVGAALAISSFGSAHPEFGAEESSPMPDEVLTSQPSEVRLVFPSGATGGIDATQSDMWVIAVQGDRVVAHGGVDLDTADRIEMFAPIEEPLENGLYRVKWVGISLNDDGFAEGDYVFAVDIDAE
jgi:methionine-rich copper-binding protein CopC